MSLNVGSLWASLSLNVSQFMSGLSQANAAASSAGASFNKAFGKTTQNNINNTANSLKNVSKQANVAFKDVSRIVSGILISQGFYRIKRAIEDVTSAIVGFHNEMNTASIAFEYFLGSAERAQGFITVMQDFAAKTPFTAASALAQARRLMAMSFEPEQLKSVMTIMTDAAAATGATAEQMDRVVLAIGQIKSKGKLEGQEIRQLGEAGIPAMQILREELGLTADQLARIGEMKIDGSTAVAAVLKGLERRYKGAADRIAETLPGMWETIKDDFLIISKELTSGVYDTFTNIVRRVRDTFETLRKAAREGGIGGIINAIFSPELQTSVRAIVSGIQSIIKSIGKLWQAIKPLVDMIGGTVIRILGIIIPIIANVVRVIVNVAQAAINASPAIRILVQVIAGLAIANLVAKGLMLLWGAVRIGAICTAIASAVTTLAKAIQALYIVLTKNPLVAIISIVAGVLLSLAMSSKVVTEWLDRLMGKLSALGGIDLNSVMKEAGSDDLNTWLEEFNKSVDKMNEDLSKTGAEAEEAGEKVKDKFVASFDELFQVPDKLDAISDSFADFGGNWPSTPTLPKFEFGLPTEGLDEGGFEFPPPYPGSDGGPPIDPTAPAVHAVAQAIQNLKRALASTKQENDNWVLDTQLAFERVGSTMSVFFGQTVPNAVREFVLSIGTGLQTAWESVVVWADNVNEAIGNWAAQAVTSVREWSTDTGTSIGKWAVDTGTSIYNWNTATGLAIRSWITETGTSIGEWVTNKSMDFQVWAENVGNTISTWTTETINNIRNWGINTGTNISTWVTTAKQNIASWVTDAGLNISTWATTTSQDIYNWGINTGENIATWVNSGVFNIGTWATNTGKTISSWLSGTAQGFADWVNNVSANIAAWGNNAQVNISAWASTSWQTFGEWLKGTSQAFTDWINGLLDGLVSWAKQAWNVLTELASLVGQQIGRGFNVVAEKVTNTVRDIGNWVSDNKDWLIPVGVGALVVGGAIATIMTGGAAAPLMAAPLALEKGGIVDKEQLVRISEKNRREAVIPMQNDTYMRPFALAIANELRQMNTTGTGDADKVINLYQIGTLIGDDRSLLLLERKLQAARLQDGRRIGGVE